MRFDARAISLDRLWNDARSLCKNLHVAGRIISRAVLIYVSIERRYRWNSVFQRNFLSKFILRLDDRT